MPSWAWGTAAGPPGSRPSEAAPDATETAPAVTLPGAEEAVSFEQHVKATFRERDRKSMRFAFDLWSVDDVRANAPDILSRLRDGSMPCDGAWPPEWVDMFDRWMQTGMNP